MKTVAVIFGSKSTEHDVSIVTAIASVIKPLEITGEYNVEPIYITKDGSWHWAPELKDIALYASGKISEFLESDPPVSVVLDGGMTLTKPGKFGRTKTQKIDVAFPATHGTYGEDGSLMGLLRMAGVPFVGCDMEASVVAMNKLLTHQTVSAAGIDTHPYVGLMREEFLADRSGALQKLAALRYPLFVKPVHLGSSIGINRVADKNELENALEVAFHYDSTAIVEEAIPNLIEVTVPIMGQGDAIRAALVERPLIDENGTFDFEAKYLKQNKGKKTGGTKGAKSGAQGYSELPAKLPGDLYEQSEQLALDVYRAVGCEGIARVDLLIDSKAGKVYFNEINPLPGSLYAHNWRAAGVSTVELVARLVQFAEERAAKQKNLATSFSTNYLKQF